MVDPVNACQLSRPGCVHSDNQAFVGGLQWPSGSMGVETFRRLLDGHGPFALNAVHHKYGEPLLNKPGAGSALAAHVSSPRCIQAKNGS